MTEFLLALRVLLSLGVVVLVLWGLSRWMHQREVAGGRAGVPVQVVGRQMLGRNHGVAVLDVGGRLLVVGMGEKSVELLTELTPELTPAVAPETPLEPKDAPLRPSPRKPLSLVTTDLEDALAGIGSQSGSQSGSESGVGPGLDSEKARPADNPPELSRRRRVEDERAARARAMAAHPAGSALPGAAARRAMPDAQVIALPLGSPRATAGSVLDPTTWKQAASAFSKLRKAK